MKFVLREPEETFSQGEPPTEYWISYSDLMAGLLLGFMLLVSVVILLYRSEIQTQASHLDQLILKQQTTLAELHLKNEKLKELDKIKKDALVKLNQLTDEQNKTLNVLRDKDRTLFQKNQELKKLDETKKQAILKLNELIENQSMMLLTLEEQEKKLADLEKNRISMMNRLDEKQQQIDHILGVKKRLVANLLQRFKDSGLKLNIDPQTGAIKFAEGILFEYNQWELTDAGKQQLQQFIPTYVKSLLGDQTLKTYISKIIIEGHTDDKGSYMYNLELSQKRAFAVAAFLHGEEMPEFEFKSELRTLVTANGRSYSQPVLSTDGSVDPEKSRRVEFKFLLKEMEKIEEIKGIIQE